MAPWLETPAGRYALAWEQQQLDALVADLFGFHAIQLGLPAIDGLRANRMPHRWLLDEPGAADSRAALLGDFHALPFASQSLDLVLLPHTLDLCLDPHATLREVERVLMPEGRVVIVGFNPDSLWGLRQAGGLMLRRLGSQGPVYLPCGEAGSGRLLSPRRLRDWLRLLGFEIDGGRFGAYRPPWRSAAWLDRWAWMESAGDRWWPMFGALHILVAVKRVAGMRLIGPAWKRPRRARAAPAVAGGHREALAPSLASLSRSSPRTPE